MPIATITDYMITPTWTNESALAVLKTAMTAAGFTLYDEYDDASSTPVSKNAVFEYVFDATKTYGKSYTRVRTSLQNGLFSNILATGWDTTTHTAIGGSVGTSTTSFGNSDFIYVKSINHPEVRGLLYIDDDGIRFSSLCLRPANKPTWWNENNYPFFFTVINTVDFESIVALPGSLSPYNHTLANYFSILRTTYMQFPNPITFARDLLPGVVLLGPRVNNQGVAGRFSDDVALAAVNTDNSRYGDTFSTGSSEYLLLDPSSGFSIRVA